MECDVECCRFECFGNSWKSRNPGQPFRKFGNLGQIARNPEIPVDFFGISQIREISYAILGSEIPFGLIGFGSSIFYYWTNL